MLKLLFNKYFINAVQNIDGKAPSCMEDSSNSGNGTSTVKRIIREHKQHPNILKDFY